MLGAWAVLLTSLLAMHKLNKTKFTIFLSLVLSLLSKDLTCQNLFKAFYIYEHGPSEQILIPSAPEVSQNLVTIGPVACEKMF